MSSISYLGNLANVVVNNNVHSFQIGDSPSATTSPMDDPAFRRSAESSMISQWLNIDGYHVLARGNNNLKAEEIEYNIKKNRLHPKLIDKQLRFLYGKGLQGYYQQYDEDGKLTRKWKREDQVFKWLESWEENGIETSYQDFALNILRRFYTFYEFFVDMRMSMGKQFGMAKYPIAGAELLENKNCRIATSKDFDTLRTLARYNDFKYIVLGSWGLTSNYFRVFRRFRFQDFKEYTTNAIAHYKQSSVGDFYGSNETYEGTKTWILNSNESPEYIRSFLENSLSAKVHIIIPNAWLEARRKQLRALCEENEKRKKENQELLKWGNTKIDIGTEYKESVFLQILGETMKEAVEFQSGKKNQGKTFFSYSFRSGNEEERWSFETLDLKYKEYIDSLISVDRRADEILTSSIGMSPSITGIIQPGKLSSSGSDAYYQIILYMSLLSPDDELCSRPFNDMLRINFPTLYNSGYRLGFYREMPSRQSEITPDERYQNQEQ